MRDGRLTERRRAGGHPLVARTILVAGTNGNTAASPSGTTSPS